MTKFLDVFDSAALPPGKTALIDMDGQPVLLCRTAEGLFAVEGRCSHALRSFDRAKLRGNTLVCAHHGARFDVTTGKHLCPPALRGLKIYAVRERAGRIEICLAGEGE